MTILNIILMALVVIFGGLALYGLVGNRADAEIIQFLEAETERLHEGLEFLEGEDQRADNNWATIQELQQELEITKAFSVYLEQGREEAREALANMNAYAADTERMYLKALRDRDELQVDIDTVSMRRAKWRDRAEAAEAQLVIADRIREHSEESMSARYKELKFSEGAYKNAWHECLELRSQDEQALIYAEEERQALKAQVKSAERFVDEAWTQSVDSATLAGKAQEALKLIALMVQEPSRLEELTQTGFDTSTLEGSTVSLVAFGLQDFVALVNERNELIQALGEAQKTQAAMGTPEAPKATKPDPFGLNDLPF